MDQLAMAEQTEGTLVDAERSTGHKNGKSDMDDTSDRPAYWVALEANPEVMTKYLEKLGVPAGHVEVVDVYGLEPELLQMVPQPVLALLILFPVTAKFEEVSREDVKRYAASRAADDLHPAGVYFTKQTVGNACGTVALIHAVANALNLSHLAEQSVLSKFFQATERMSPEERADYLRSDRGFFERHTEVAREGQTSAPAAEENINFHFIALLHKNGHLYEMDGRKPFPVDHGRTTPNSFLQDASQVVKRFMEQQPDSLHFTLLALVGKDSASTK